LTTARRPAHDGATFDTLNRMRGLFDRPPLDPMEQSPLDRKPALNKLFAKKQ
jgi:hypothetical protein